MTSTLNRISPVVAELFVEIPADDVKKALNKAYTDLGRTARVSGFRRGKVPRNVLKQMFGQAVRADVAGDLVSEHSRTAIEEHGVVPISKPNVDAKPLAENEGFSFKIQFETRPELDAVSYDGIELDRYQVEVTAEMVEKELESLRSSTAEVVDLEEPRPAAKGDLVKFNLKRWEEGKWEEIKGEQELVLGEGRAMEAVEDALEGVEVGQEKVIDLGSESEMEENRRRILVNVTAVQGRKLPALDDELAKDVGDFETLDALKKDIERRLLENMEEAEQRRLQRSLFDALREKNEVDLPPSLVAQQTMQLQMQLFQLAGAQAFDGEKQKELFEDAKETAGKMIHQELLMLEIARLENIEVSDEQVDAEIEKMAADKGLPLPMLKAEYQKDDRVDQLRHSLLEKKVFDFAVAKVKITQKPQPAAEDADE